MFSSFSTRDRLRRSMSTRSMRKSRPAPELEPLDPEIARAHAAAAASRAMRTSERFSMESRNSYDQLGRPANVAIPRRRPNSSLQYTEDNASVSAAHVVPTVTPRQSMDTASSMQAPSLEQSAALPPITEFRGMDGRDSSVPSSYRRLRKAKSMFSTRQRLSYAAFGTSPISHRNNGDLDRSPEFELPRTLRHSISFMRGSNRQGSRRNRQSRSQDAAIQLARNQFLVQGDETASHAQRSSFFSSKRKREHRPFRKTFRHASDGGINASPTSGDPNLNRPRSRPRTISASLKHGLKRVFGISKSTEPPSESHHVQTCSREQAETPARSCRASNVKGDGTVINPGLESTPMRAPTVAPSPDSFGTSDSRVTSWADSTVANTVTTRRTGHRQSLSQIEEIVDVSHQLPQVSVSGADGQPVSRTRLDVHKHEGYVNSQDLYSALIQRIGRNAAHNDDDGITIGRVPEHRVVPERTSSVYSHRSKHTIRHIPSVESSTSPGSFATARVEFLTPQRHHARSIRYIHPNKNSWSAQGQENARPIDGFPRIKSPQSASIIGEQSDEETGSVIIARFGNSNDMVVSPSSLYSRTMSGEKLTNTLQNDKTLSLSPGELGTATIYASERTIYSSPKRSSDSVSSKVPVRSSAEWQQWMSSEMERIEKTSPTKVHVREGAHFSDDDDDDGIFMGMMRRAPHAEPGKAGLSYVPDNVACSDVQPSGLPKAPGPNNFSRPFSRSSSVRTILSSQKMEQSMGMTQESANVQGISTDDNLPKVSSIPTLNCSESCLSPMRMRTANLLPAPESPTPQRNGAELPSKAWTQEQYRRYSTRRPLVTMKPNQFRSVRTQRNHQGLNSENTRKQVEQEDFMAEYHKEYQKQNTVSTMSSKHMVEMFLDSRRRRMGMEMPAAATDEAFL